MKINAFGVLPLFLLLSTVCCAEEDFYGIQMKNELWAKNLVLGMGPEADSQDLTKGQVLDHAVYAEASLKPAANGRINFHINVINNSAVPISSDSYRRDFFIYTKDGRKYPLLDEEDDPNLDLIEPKSSRTFSPSLGNLKIQNDDVRMIRCAFDFGKTEIFLFPWSKKEAIKQLISPALSTSVNAGKSEMLKDDQTWVSPSRERLNQAIKNFVYTLSSDKTPVGWSTTKSVENSSDSSSMEYGARVIEYNKKYNFVTVNLGIKDGLKKNTTLRILRGGKVVAKAKVRQLREAIAAATLLPSTTQTEVRPGDKISLD